VLVQPGPGRVAEQHPSGLGVYEDMGALVVLDLEGEVLGLVQVGAEGLLALVAGPAAGRPVAHHPLMRATVPLVFRTGAALEDLGHGGLYLPGLEPFLHMPLAEPQVPAHPVPPKAPLPPAAVDGLLRHAQIGSQFLDGKEPVRAAHGSRAPGSPVPGRSTLTSGRVVKLSPAPGPGHGSFRAADSRQGRSGAREPVAAWAGRRGSRAAAVGAALLSSRVLARAEAGRQGGLACRPGQVRSSADSARHVKVAPAAGQDAHRDGGVAAVRPGWRAWARHAHGPGEYARFPAAGRRGP
jgi:hypothetical protein